MHDEPQNRSIPLWFIERGEVVAKRNGNHQIIQEVLRRRDDERFSRERDLPHNRYDYHLQIDARRDGERVVFTRVRWAVMQSDRGAKALEWRSEGYQCIADEIDESTGRLVMTWLRCDGVSHAWASDVLTGKIPVNADWRAVLPVRVGA